jgi:hypothetical protein
MTTDAKESGEESRQSAQRGAMVKASPRRHSSAPSESESLGGGRRRIGMTASVIRRHGV